MTAAEIRREQVCAALTQVMHDTYHHAPRALLAALTDAMCTQVEQDQQAHDRGVVA